MRDRGLERQRATHDSAPARNSRIPDLPIAVAVLAGSTGTAYLAFEVLCGSGAWAALAVSLLVLPESLRVVLQGARVRPSNRNRLTRPPSRGGS